MRIISQATITRYCDIYPTARSPMAAWTAAVRKASWKGPKDIKAQYPSASFLADNRVVFNIAGNNFRLVVAVAYRIQVVYIKFIGTHDAYDRINAISVEPA